MRQIKESFSCRSAISGFWQAYFSCLLFGGLFKPAAKSGTNFVYTRFGWGMQVQSENSAVPAPVFSGMPELFKKLKPIETLLFCRLDGPDARKRFGYADEIEYGIHRDRKAMR